MRITRKTLQAENDQLRAQIAVHNHVTRKGLNEMVRLTVERNKYLLAELAKVALKESAPA